MPRSVDEIEDIFLARFACIRHSHRLALDRDASLTLNIHRIEHLVVEIAVGDEPGAIERAIDAVRGRWPHRVVDVDDEPAQTWREFATIMTVDDGVLIVPAWMDLAAAPEARLGATAPTRVVRIEPGGAFGFGDHPTTMLSLRAVRRLVVSDAEVIDVGCGTGVIAVLVAMLQGRPVRAIDVAAAAVEATIDNARRNEVGDRVIADAANLCDIDADYDVVVANTPTRSRGMSTPSDTMRTATSQGRSFWANSAIFFEAVGSSLTTTSAGVPNRSRSRRAIP